MVTRWTPEQSGCIFEGAASRTGDELSVSVVQLAVENGWTLDAETVALAESLWSVDAGVSGCHHFDDPDVAGAMLEAARDAEAWMNEHLAPEGYEFAFDDGFYLWKIDEDTL